MVLYLEHINYSEKVQFWIFTILVTLLPAISFAAGFKFIEEKNLIKYGLYAGVFAVGLSIFAYLGTVGYDFSSLYSGRMSLISDNLDLSVLNPITIGHTGVSLILLSFAYSVRFGFLNRINILIISTGYTIGFVALIASGSRGPVLSLLACMIFSFLLKGISYKGALYVFLLLLAIFLTTNFSDIYIFERMHDNLFKDDARDTILINTFILIRENFFTGSGVFAMDAYPHNLIIESLLVLGFFGFCFFVIIVLISIYYACIMYKRNLSIIFPLLYIQYFVFYMVSGSISEALMFWLIIFLFLFFNIKKNKNKTLASEFEL